MEKEKNVVSRSRKRPFRLTWINPRTGLMCSLRYASYAGAIDRLYSMIKREDIVCVEIGSALPVVFTSGATLMLMFVLCTRMGEVAL